MKIVLLFAACSFIANGRNFENGQNKRDLIMKALTDIRKKAIWSPQQAMVYPDDEYNLNGQQNGFNGKVSQVQAVLQVLIENLELFKGEDNDEQTDVLQAEVEDLNEEILKLNETLSEFIESSLQEPLWILCWQLYDMYHDDFYIPFWNAFGHDEEIILAEEYETTGNEYTSLSPVGQITERVKELEKLAKMIMTDRQSSYDLVMAIQTALKHIASVSKNTTNASSSEASTASQGTTEDSTTEQTSTPEGSIAEQTGTTDEQFANTGTTESQEVRKENVLRRQLLDLSLRKINWIDIRQTCWRTRRHSWTLTGIIC